MYIMAQEGNQIINSEFVARFALAYKPEVTKLLACYVQTQQPAIIGHYTKDENPKEILANLMSDLASDKAMVYLPDSKWLHPEKEIKDARVKRKGGS